MKVCHPGIAGQPACAARRAAGGPSRRHGQLPERADRQRFSGRGREQRRLLHGNGCDISDNEAVLAGVLAGLRFLPEGVHHECSAPSALLPACTCRHMHPSGQSETSTRQLCTLCISADTMASTAIYQSHVWRRTPSAHTSESASTCSTIEHAARCRVVNSLRRGAGGSTKPSADPLQPA